jgi:hypothetical protein
VASTLAPYVCVARVASPDRDEAPESRCGIWRAPTLDAYGAAPRRAADRSPRCRGQPVATLPLRGLLFRFGGRCRPTPRRRSRPGGELTRFEAERTQESCFLVAERSLLREDRTRSGALRVHAPAGVVPPQPAEHLRHRRVSGDVSAGSSLNARDPAGVRGLGWHLIGLEPHAEIVITFESLGHARQRRSMRRPLRPADARTQTAAGVPSNPGSP